MRVKKPNKQQLVEFEKNYVGYKIKLYPTEEQIKLINEYFGFRRFVYNYCLYLQDQYYEKNKTIIGGYKLANYYIRPLKDQEEYKWLDQYDSKVMEIACQELYKTYDNYLNSDNSACHPKYKKKRSFANQNFGIRKDRMSISKKGLEIPGFRSHIDGRSKNLKNTNCIDIKFNDLPKELQKIIEGDGNNEKKNIIYKNYMNPRIEFDGVNYYITFSLEEQIIYYEEENEEGELETKQIRVCSNSVKNHKYNPEWQEKPKSRPIGIDLGCKQDNWIKDSEGNVVIRPDQSKEDKKIAECQRKAAHKREVNIKRLGKSKAQATFTKNEIKLRKEENEEYKKITNRKKNDVYNYANKLVDLKPLYVVLETLSVKEMIKSNKEYANSSEHLNRLNKNLKDAMLYEVGQIIEQTLTNNGIPVYRADSQYPSSQICPRCRHVHNIGSDDTYICPNCGYAENRDKNAADNLANYEEGWKTVELSGEKFIIYPNKKIPLVSFS